MFIACERRNKNKGEGKVFLYFYMFALSYAFARLLIQSPTMKPESFPSVQHKALKYYPSRVMIMVLMVVVARYGTWELYNK